MKLHLPKMLLAAVIAASCAVQTTYADGTGWSDNILYIGGNERYDNTINTGVTFTPDDAETADVNEAFTSIEIADATSKTEYTELEIRAELNKSDSDAPHKAWIGELKVNGGITVNVCTNPWDHETGTNRFFDALTIDKLSVTDGGAAALNISKAQHVVNVGEISGSLSTATVAGTLTLGTAESATATHSISNVSVAQGGSLVLAGGKLATSSLTMNGSLSLSDNTVVELTNGTTTLTAGNKITGTGTVRIGQGGVLVQDISGSRAVTSNIEVAAGGTLKLAQGDALHWGDGTNALAGIIALEGASDNLAKMEVTNKQTLSVNINLNGNSQVTGGQLEFFGAGITASKTNNTIASNLMARSAATITVQENSELVVSGDITCNSGYYPNPGAITKAGNGKLVLSGSSNTFYGALNVTDGTLELTNGLTLTQANSDSSSGSLSLSDGATLIIGSKITNTAAGTVALGGNVVINTDGNYDLIDSESVSYSEGNGNGFRTVTNGTYTLISGGTVDLTGIDSVTLDGTTTTTTINTLEGGGASFAVSGDVTGTTFYATSGEVTANAAVQASAKAYEINGGTLKVTEGSIASGSITVSEAGGTLAVGGTAAITGTFTANNANLNISGGSMETVVVNNGASAFTMTGGSIDTVRLTDESSNLNFKVAEGQTTSESSIGLIEFTAKNGYSRNMTVDAGVTLNVEHINNGWGMGTMTINGELNVSEEFSLATGGNGSTTNNVITGTGTINMKTLAIGNIGTYNFSGVTMKIGAGGITKGNNYYGWNPANLGNVLIEATADWSSEVDKLTLVATGAESTVINTAGHTVDMKKSLEGSGNLTKTGAGTLKMGSKTNALGGAVEVSGGSLSFYNAEEGASTTLDNLKLSGGTLDVTGSLTLNALSIDLSKYSTDQETYTLISAGTLGLGAGVDLATLGGEVNGYTATVKQSDNSVTLSFAEIVAPGGPITTTVTDIDSFADGVLTLIIDKSITSADLKANITGFGDGVLDRILSLTATDADGIVGITLIDTDELTNDSIVGNGADNLGFYGAYYGEGAGAGYQVAYIPEPATATLSLLALAGLAARRRRKH